MGITLLFAILFKNQLVRIDRIIIYIMNPDLVNERKKSSFNVEEMSYLLDGSREKTMRKKFLQDIANKEHSFNKVFR